MPRCCSSVVRKEGHHFWLIRLLRTSVVALRPATGDAVPGPGPQTQRIAFGNPTWHFSLFASSMIVRERRWRRRVSSRTGSAEDRANADLGSQASDRSIPSMLMLLAQNDKCRGAGAGPPSHREVRENRMSRQSPSHALRGTFRSQTMLEVPTRRTSQAGPFRTCIQTREQGPLLVCPASSVCQKS
jgi:hypothetical protein